jgi:hypothetical protein
MTGRWGEYFLYSLCLVSSLFLTGSQFAKIKIPLDFRVFLIHFMSLCWIVLFCAFGMIHFTPSEMSLQWWKFGVWGTLGALMFSWGAYFYLNFSEDITQIKVKLFWRAPLLGYLVGLLGPSALFFCGLLFWGGALGWSLKKGRQGWLISRKLIKFFVFVIFFSLVTFFFSSPSVLLFLALLLLKGHFNMVEFFYVKVLFQHFSYRPVS